MRRFAGCWCWLFGVGLFVVDVVVVVTVINNNEIINEIINKIIVQLGNPTSGDAEEAHGAANPAQREVAADEFMEFKGVLLRTRFLKAVADPLFVGDDLIPHGILVHAHRQELADVPVLPHLEFLAKENPLPRPAVTADDLAVLVLGRLRLRHVPHGQPPTARIVGFHLDVRPHRLRGELQQLRQVRRLAPQEHVVVEAVGAAADFAGVQGDNLLAEQVAARFRPQNLHLGSGHVLGEVDGGEECELGREVAASGPLDAPGQLVGLVHEAVKGVPSVLGVVKGTQPLLRTKLKQSRCWGTIYHCTFLEPVALGS